MTALDWDDIQGGVLRGYGFDHARHLVLTVTDPAGGRRWLDELVPAVTPGTRWAEQPATTLNVAFTHRGLSALGAGARSLASFPADLREGMPARAPEHLGDVGPAAPAGWEATGVHHPAAHVLVMVHGHREDEVAAACDRIAVRAADHALGLVHTEALAHLPDVDRAGAPSALRTEHFGFADGVSQPAVDGALEPTIVVGNGTPLPDGTWRPVRPGEFVLGYPDEEEPEPPRPAPDALVRNGSYLVVRKLAQDVAAFRAMVAAHADRHGLEPELLAAKLVGRRGDGSPLRPQGAADPGTNDVRYADDPDGHGAPAGSHVRRANPRDALGLDLAPELVSRHRLLRRGMPYGPPLPDGVLEDDGVPRGLLLLAYCASISRQFEFVQREWLNDGNAFGVGWTPDPLVGHGSAPRRFVVPGTCPVFLGDLPPVVRPVGGEYLFQPGLDGLRYLAAGPHPGE